MSIAGLELTCINNFAFATLVPVAFSLYNYLFIYRLIFSIPLLLLLMCSFLFNGCLAAILNSSFGSCLHDDKWQRRSEN